MGRVLTRHVLRTRHGLRDIAFTQTGFGRPLLRCPAGTGIDFNISHTGRWVGCATCVQGMIGLDLVHTADFADWPDFVEEYLAPEELRTVRRQDASSAMKLAARYWAAKEAILKAMGTGLARDPRSLVLDLSKGVMVTGTHECWGRCDFVVHETSLGSGCHACIAVAFDPSHSEAGGSTRLTMTYVPAALLIGQSPRLNGRDAAMPHSLRH